MLGEQRPRAARILVVEDDPAIADALATALRYEGYEVEGASSDHEAVAAFERLNPDLIILDWALPDIESVEIRRRLREQGLGPAIIILTAKGSIQDKVNALGAGADDYITKPFNLDEVVARAIAVLRRRTAHSRISLDPPR